MSGPLENVKVVDAGRNVAGPYCAKLLADLGADVIKVERPLIGDDTRRIGRSFAPPGEVETSALSLYTNTNKRGITLNLEAEEGKQAFRKLVAWADVLVEDMRPSYLAGLGLGYPELEPLNPRLVMTSITPFGQTGPYRDYETSEITAQALAGMMFFNGEEDGEPLRYPRHQSTMVGGLNASGVTLAALFCARATGQGQHADVSIQESVATFYYSNLALYSYTGMVASRGLGELYPCKDGWVMPLKGRAEWDGYAIFFDAMELIDEKYQTPQGQQRYSAEIRKVLTDKLAGRERYEFFHAGQAAGYPFGLVQDLEDVVACPQLEARHFFQELEHPTAGVARYPTTPFQMSASPQQPWRPAPVLGQHNSEVYVDLLGYTEEELEALHERGVV